MNATAKLTAYGAALVLVAAGAWAIGTAVGPIAGAAPAATGDAEHGGTVAVAAQIDQPGGLASSREGHTFAPTDTTLTPGTTEPFTFRIIGPDGRPVTAYDVEHDKRLHLVVVRRDTSGYQHLHPELAADGTWSVPLTVADAGSYRAFADFSPTGGAATTLGVDLSAPGDYQPVGHGESRVAEVDGYRVTLDGELAAGASSPVTATVTRDGVPVTDLQPYLGAYGHLVALRTGDLAYLHVHPDGAPGDGRTPAGPGITFHAEVPSAGGYRMFLDFRHAGVVRTAEFTVTTGGAPAPVPAGAPDPAGHDGVDADAPHEGGH